VCQSGVVWLKTELSLHLFESVNALVLQVNQLVHHLDARAIGGVQLFVSLVQKPVKGVN